MIKKLVMLGVIGFMAIGFPSFVCGGGVNSNSPSSQTNQAQKEYIRLKTENALDLKPLIGKDIKSLNIPEEAIKYIGAHPFAVYYESTFLGYPCTSLLLSFSYDRTSKADLVKSITISCKQPSFMECKTYLEEQLGESYYSGATPYAAVNGGAVTYFTYYKDGYKYHLSMASARNYYTLEICKEEPKGAPYHALTGMALLPNTSTPKTPALMSKPAVPANISDTWTCEECGYTTNKGKFCGECGRLRPDRR